MNFKKIRKQSLSQCEIIEKRQSPNESIGNNLPVYGNQKETILKFIFAEKSLNES